MQVPVQILHMNGGQGENSYYRNSLTQKKIILTAKPILEQNIAELVCEKSLSETECLTMADFGCSSGPNTLLPLLEIIETIDSTCTKLNCKPPNLQYFLNDLPGNDYNTIFRSLIPKFDQKLEKVSKFENCLIGAMPGSFYERLFPSKSLHFVHSSASLHWLSQVPKGLVSASGIPLNKGGTFFVNESSPTNVQKAYVDQFEKDFTKFLKSRSVEMVSGGHMVITFIAKSDKNPMQLIQNCLRQMVNEGMIQESKLDNFSVPLYTPCEEEVRNAIKWENSFKIKDIKEFEISWDANIEDGNTELCFDILERGKYVVNYFRVITEPMLVTHFGDVVFNNLFHRLSSQVIDCLEKRMGLTKYVVASMGKK